MTLEKTQKRTVREIRLWPALMGLLLVAGIAHFAAPERFAAIVPTALPGSRHFWVFVSGATEISLAIALQISASRRLAATLAVIFFVLVFPANIKMAVDWASRPRLDFAIALLRLPLQIPLIWLAYAVRTRATRPLDADL